MKLIVANWKENPPRLQQARMLLQRLNRLKPAHKVVLCIPYIYLPAVKTKYDLGSQNIFWEESGAHTGEISGSMLKQFKVKYAIVGHSERRKLGETEQQVNAKIKAALADKITPILCVGFGLAPEMGDEEVLMHLQHQLNAYLEGVDSSKVIVAYEPVWAISSGDSRQTKKIPDPEHAERVAMFIRIKFKTAKVLYGGSTNADNAPGFLRTQIDGLLVGASSLDFGEFKKIIS